MREKRHAFRPYSLHVGAVKDFRQSLIVAVVQVPFVRVPSE